MMGFTFRNHQPGQQQTTAGHTWSSGTYHILMLAECHWSPGNEKVLTSHFNNSQTLHPDVVCWKVKLLDTEPGDPSHRLVLADDVDAAPEHNHDADSDDVVDYIPGHEQGRTDIEVSGGWVVSVRLEKVSLLRHMENDQDGNDQLDDQILNQVPP